jgi:hypothetical protein
MTAQQPDNLQWNGEHYFVHCEPLEPYFRDGQERPNFSEHGSLVTCCWRGYVASWDIRDKKLYLNALEAFGLHRKNLLPLVFGESSAPVFAQWFSGKLQLVNGEMTNYVHAGYASTYENETTLSFKNGTLTVS